MPSQFWSRTWLYVSALSFVAGLVYFSWPLGAWLNPAANHGLASNLEAAGQPYRWVFVGLDIVSGLLVVTVCWWLLRTAPKMNIWLKIALWAFGTFGLLTAIDALMPLDCVSVIQKCGNTFDDPWFIVHGLFSIGSIAALTLSILCIWWITIRNKHVGLILKLLLDGTVLTWVGFGVFTLVLLLLSQTSTTGQHIFIGVVSAWMAFMPYLTWQAAKKV